MRVTGDSGTLSWTFFAHEGNSVTGTVEVVEDRARSGELAGTLSANTLTFTFTFSMDCVRTVTGTTTFEADSASGTFSGQDCNRSPISIGRLSLSIQRPSPSALAGTAWYPAVTGPTGGLFGFDSWSWQFVEVTGNVGGRADVSGMAIVGCSAGRTGCHSQGPVSGTLAYQGFDYFPGTTNPRHWWRLALVMTVSGRCPASLSGTTSGFGIGAMATQLSGSLSGTTCMGAVNDFAFQLPGQ
jgi:hypothetical protein